MLYIRKDTCYRRFKRVIRLLPCVPQIKERQIGIVLQLECVDSSLEFVMTVKEPLRHAPNKAEFPDLTKNRLQLLLQGGNLFGDIILVDFRIADMQIQSQRCPCRIGPFIDALSKYLRCQSVDNGPDELFRKIRLFVYISVSSRPTVSDRGPSKFPIPHR